jgi:hypothetical protein
MFSECPTCGFPASVSRTYQMEAHVGGEDCCHLIVMARWTCVNGHHWDAEE